MAALLVSEVLWPTCQPGWTNKQNRQWQYPVCWYFKLRGHDNTIAAVCSGLLHCFCSLRPTNSWLTLASRKHSGPARLIDVLPHPDIRIFWLNNFEIEQCRIVFDSLPTLIQWILGMLYNLITWSYRDSLINTMHRSGVPEKLLFNI